eukprot:gene29602-36886_t
MASPFASFFTTNVCDDDDDDARDSTDDIGERLYDSMTELLMKEIAEGSESLASLSSVKEEIAERMNFFPSRNGNPNLKKPQSVKVILRGRRVIADGQSRGDDAVLKISLVDGEAIRRCRDVHDISASHRLSALNECIWLQQLAAPSYRFRDGADPISPRVLDMRLWRPHPLTTHGDKRKIADPVFVAVLMKKCGVSVCAWLSSDDREGVFDVVGSGAGFRLLKRGSEHERHLANRILRRIILLLTRRLHRLQSLNGLVHHDLHTDNVLLYRRPEDEMHAVYPVISDYEFAEGMLRTSTASEYIAGSYPFSYANNLTYSYDLYRFLSDLLYVIYRNGLIDRVNADVVAWLRQRVAARFDENVAHAEHTAACGNLRRRYQLRIFQPHLRDLACDPIEILRWQAWLKTVAEDVRDDRAEIAADRSRELESARDTTTASCFWLRWLKTQTRELVPRRDGLHATVNREGYCRAIDRLNIHGSNDLDSRSYARLPLFDVLRAAIRYFVYRLDEVAVSVSTLHLSFFVYLIITTIDLRLIARSFSQAHHQVKVGTARSELPGYAWCCYDDAYLPGQHADLFTRLRLVQSVLSVFFLWLRESSSARGDDDADWIAAAFPPPIQASAIPSPAHIRECRRFAEGVLAATAVVL